MRPNLFSWATKELSQDAFICWLAEWANPSNKSIDEYMFKAGTEFIKRLLKTHKICSTGINRVEILRQYYNIDAVFKIDTDDGNYVLIIEDKIHAQDYNPLEDYVKTITDDAKFNGYQPKGVFLKTGDQATYKNVVSKGYSLFLRKDFLLFFQEMQTYSGCNQIFNDYFANLDGYNSHINSFEILPVKDWHWNSWKGFYEFLQTEVDIVDWKEVNPPGGNSFLGAWWHFREWKNFSVYLQIEQGDLCFKIGEVYEDDCDQSLIRKEWYSIIVKEAAKQDFHEITKPYRFGQGVYMTVAKVDKKEWLGPDENIIDKDAIVKILKKYENFLDSCILHKDIQAHEFNENHPIVT
jgi:hypothetical protein